MDIDVGERLRDLRERSGLSQRAIAARAGLTSATISMIENNRISPSVGTLKSIVEGIGLSLSDFFAPAMPKKERVFFPAGELIELGDGEISYRQVGTDLRGKALQILHERYPAGADTGRNRLRHRGYEGGVVVRGRLEVTVAQQRRVLSAGDAYLFDSNIPHRFRNPGAEECEVVSACTPPTF
jgi:transcriptional regulator with XRE-family HTH domain